MLYGFLKTMKWNHLPVAGGLYDQHPQFVEDMHTLMQLDNEAQERAEQKRKNQEKQNMGQKSGKRGGRRRR